VANHDAAHQRQHGDRYEMPDREQGGLMKARTSFLKRLSASTMALLVIMVAGYLMSERASAQRAPAPGDPVLTAIQEVQRTIVGLQVNVNTLVDAHFALSDIHFRWTPAADAAYDSLQCIVVNISDVEKTIHVELKRGDGSNETEATVNVAPGATGRALTANRSGQFHCKFSIVNGTRADIRAALLGFGPSGHSFQIPAE
jgi:hypothetical protein